MRSTTFDLPGHRCLVRADAAITTRMSAYLAPFAAAGSADHAEMTVRIAVDPAALTAARRRFETGAPAACRTSFPGHRYRVWRLGEGEVLIPAVSPDHLIDTTQATITITADTPRTAATIGTRVMRQLILRGAERLGGHLVHAGGVIDRDGTAVLVGGRAGAGKTTVLTELLTRGAAPAAGDRTLLIPASSSWRAVAVPLAWRFTPEGIAASPALTHAWKTRTPARGRDLVDGKAELTPSEVAAIFGRSLVASAPLRRIILLNRSAAPAPATVDGTAVRRCLAFGAEDPFATDWLNLYPARPAGPAARWWDTLADQIPVLVLRWTDTAQLPEVAAAAHGWSEP